MRTLLLASLAALTLCTGCGQKGPLVLPQKSVATPVVIRAPDAQPDGAAPAPPPPAPQQKDDESPPPPQG